jgi:hypothetical protein
MESVVSCMSLAGVGVLSGSDCEVSSGSFWYWNRCLPLRSWLRQCQKTCVVPSVCLDALAFLVSVMFVYIAGLYCFLVEDKEKCKRITFCYISTNGLGKRRKFAN